MSRFNPRLIVVVLFAVVGYVAFHFLGTKPTLWREFTASPDTKMTAFALLSRHEDGYGKDADWMAAQPKFHGEVILSQTPVQDANARGELRQTFARITPIDFGAACIPEFRHGLRFEKDERTVDAMICFGCGQMEIFDSASKPQHVDFSVDAGKSRDQFDAVFARLGLKQFKPYAEKKMR